MNIRCYITRDFWKVNIRCYISKDFWKVLLILCLSLSLSLSSKMFDYFAIFFSFYFYFTLKTWKSLFRTLIRTVFWTKVIISKLKLRKTCCVIPTRGRGSALVNFTMHCRISFKNNFTPTKYLDKKCLFG